jgi:ribose transport system substrate-binding protein
MKRMLRWCTAVVVCVVSIGCGEPGAGPAASRTSQTPGKLTKGTIGLSVLTTTNPFFVVIAENMEQEAAQHGYKLVWVSGDEDVNKQHDQVQDFIAQGVSAIVLCPCDKNSIAPAIRAANEAGIPVFTADLACMADDVDVVSHIATDNRGGGVLAGEAMIEALGEEGGKIAILDYKSAESCLQRVEGFKEKIAKHNQGRESGKIEIVAELPGGGNKDQGRAATQDALQAQPDLRGIFAINDPSGLGAVAALEEAGKADQVAIIAFDGQPEGKQAIRDGKIYADPIQYPDEIGRKTVQAIARYFEGQDVEPQILIPTSIYRKADAEKDPELQ